MSGVSWEEDDSRQIRTSHVFIKTKAQSYTIDGKPNHLQEKLDNLQMHYSQMESEYFKKIKELKAQLVERTRKQAALGSQVTKLREQYLEHQLQITKLSEQLSNEEKKKSVEGKVNKKSSSPRLLKKSLEYNKNPNNDTFHNKKEEKTGIQKNSSPYSHRNQQMNNVLGGQLLHNQVNNEQIRKKAYSPTLKQKQTNHYSPVNQQKPEKTKDQMPVHAQIYKKHEVQKQKIFHGEKNGKDTLQKERDRTAYNQIESEKAKRQKIQILDSFEEKTNIGNMEKKKQEQKSPVNVIKKKSLSPTLVSKGFLINSIKDLDKQKNIINGSPKRPSQRLSPGMGLRKSGKLLVFGTKSQPVKQQKRQLIGLKERMQIFK